MGGDCHSFLGHLGCSTEYLATSPGDLSHPLYHAHPAFSHLHMSALCGQA